MYTPQEMAVVIKDSAKNKAVSINRMLIECGAGAGLIGNMMKGQAPSAISLAKVADYLETPLTEIMGIEKPAYSAGGRDKLIQATLNEVKGLDDDAKAMVLEYARYLGQKQTQAL